MIIYDYQSVLSRGRVNHYLIFYFFIITMLLIKWSFHVLRCWLDGSHPSFISCLHHLCCLVTVCLHGGAWPPAHLCCLSAEKKGFMFRFKSVFTTIFLSYILYIYTLINHDNSCYTIFFFKLVFLW